MSQLSPILPGQTYPAKHSEYVLLPGKGALHGAFRLALGFFEYSRRYLLRSDSNVVISQSIDVIPQQTCEPIVSDGTAVMDQDEREYLVEMGRWHQRRQRRYRNRHR